MQRVRSPEAELKYRKELIRIAVKVYLEVRGRYAPRSDAVLRFMARQYIHKQPSNKWFKLFWRVCEFLLETKADYSNTMESLLRDYFTSIFEHFDSFGYTPTTKNMGCSSANQVRFLDYTAAYEQDFDSAYWRYSSKTEEEVRLAAKQAIQAANDARRQLIVAAEQGSYDQTGIGVREVNLTN